MDRQCLLQLSPPPGLLTGHHFDLNIALLVVNWFHILRQWSRSFWCLLASGCVLHVVDWLLCSQSCATSLSSRNCSGGCLSPACADGMRCVSIFVAHHLLLIYPDTHAPRSLSHIALLVHCTFTMVYYATPVQVFYSVFPATEHAALDRLYRSVRSLGVVAAEYLGNFRRCVGQIWQWHSSQSRFRWFLSLSFLLSQSPLSVATPS